jgi:glycosyltransferase involved in cell wall biosynthesis
LGKATDAYLKNGKQSVITPFGIDLSVFKPGEKPGGGNLTVGIVKTLEPKYGVEYLIRAFAKIKGTQPNLNLLVVGEGSLRSGLEQLTNELGIAQQTRFIGRVPHQEVPEWLAEIDVFVNPSVHESETFGVAVLEASACEKPVVVSNVGGLPEVVQDGVTGFLAPPRDVNALAEKLKILIKDAKLRQRMGKAGREFVRKNCDWNNNAKIMEKLYEQLIRK